MTAIKTTSDCTRIVSGGGEGQVRVWSVGVGGASYKMKGAMKEHKGQPCIVYVIALYHVTMILSELTLS